MSYFLKRAHAFHRAVDFLKRSEIRGAFYEFGVSTGQTAISAMNAAKALAAPAPAGGLDRFFLFDSFKGLPAPTHVGDQLEGYQAIWEGRFAVSEEDVRASITSAGHNLDSTVMIPGFYEDSLKDPATQALVSGAPAALVHMDSDMYLSTLESLNFMTGRFLDGALMMFDDWYIYRGRPDKGVQKAFNEWVGDSGLIVHEYFKYHWAGVCFICNTVQEA